MRFINGLDPTEEELRKWAYDSQAHAPVQDWELVLSWGMSRERFQQVIQFAADPNCPQAAFFLDVLFQWVSVIAKSQDYEIVRTHYDTWLQDVRGIRDKRVKEWRHKAGLLFQGQRQFDYDAWVQEWSNTSRSPEE